VNREYPDESYQQSVRHILPAFRLLELARRRLGNDAIDRLYLALGTAHHGRGEDLGDVETLRRAATEAGIDPALVSVAVEDTSLDEELNAQYAAAEAAGAIAVPTLFIGDAAPLYGPVINAVPSEEEAHGLWEDVLRLSRRPYFFELKRKR
jgi:predicted DsbA family dithiol-disulfide isomerase